jgi:hypothetical protein
MNLHYPIVLVMALSACTPRTPAVEDRGSPAHDVGASAPGPSPIPVSEIDGWSGKDDQTWVTDRTGGTNYPRLMYSARASDAMSINLQCREADRLLVTIVRQGAGDKAGEWPFTLISGQTRQALSGIIQRAEDGQAFIEAVSRPDLDIFKALRTSGRLTLEDSQGDHEMNAINDVERRAINDFFDTCAVK